ncbi:terminase family protein [uncultured Phascolarctobacterium sp.]|uniref:terminase large subunit domain-containing protein n=1 Tax=uncultured Phascolarctobacterium sp. TaxID=512296 RepID=UPI0025FE6A9A|nr:terminase family protein [uncultured Phascolarctobacterium sp.]
MAIASNVIEIDYVPRPFWRDILHPALEQYRFSVIVAHRRFGKSVGSINHIIKKAVTMTKYEAPNYAYLAPFLKQAKMIAWDYLKRYTAAIPGRKINESELYVELPSFHPNVRGARIYIIGADRPDGLRGTYWDGVVIDEYAQIRKELWGEVIRPALSDRRGWAVFIGTPKGQNQFYDIYLKAKKNNSWFTCLYDVDQTGIIPTEELEEMKREMTPAEIRQELYCDFAANASNKLISLDSINEAMSRELSEAEYKDLPKILGVDVARFGDDRSVMIRRQGLKVWEPKTRKEVDNMTFAGMLAQEIDDWMPDVVFIDAGRGEGVIDRLRQLGYKQVIEVPFGGKAILDTRYVNKRAEMWDSCRQWLEQGGDLPYMPELRQELSMPEYSFDGLNRIKLESKESIKDKTGYSPDLADALCLTFAFPVNNTRRNAFMRAKKLGLTRKYGKM